MPRLQKISNTTNRNKMQTILGRIQRMQQKWYEHLLRMEDSCWPKRTQRILHVWDENKHDEKMINEKCQAVEAEDGYGMIVNHCVVKDSLIEKMDIGAPTCFLSHYRGVLNRTEKLYQVNVCAMWAH